MSSFIQQLKERVSGEVRTDPLSLRQYSVDASIYELTPSVILLPKNKEDIFIAVQLAHQYKVPVSSRGAATGITGGCLGTGLIIDTSKYLRTIHGVNLEQEWALVDPGVVQAQLNDALAPHGYRLGPDTSTGNRATVGGMLANNSAGAHSLIYGRMVDHIQEVELVLYDGTVLHLGPVSTEQAQKFSQSDSHEGRIYREVLRIQQEYAEDIRNSFPDIPRRVAGYNLDELLKEGPLNLAKLVAGSEGSLGVITEIKVGISKRVPVTGIVALQFEDLIEGLSHVPQLLKHHPIALELIDEQIIEMGRLSPSMRGKIHWIKGEPAALFVAEFGGKTEQEVSEKLSSFVEFCKKECIAYARECFLLPEDIANVWKVREAGLGLLMSRRSYSRAIAFVEDVSVAPEQLAPFMKKFRFCLAEKDKIAGIYGHIGPGCVHVRPYVDLRKQEDLEIMEQLMHESMQLLLEYEGSLSGEHGDGLLRSWTHEIMYGPKILQAFRELKEAFDPEGLMNPGKIVPNQGFLENLRASPKQPVVSLPHALDWSREGGFELSIDMCNGNAACRKRTGTMCPSFHVTGDERDTTRARAQSLRALVTGRMDQTALTDPELLKVLDLCLECKGCKTECPSQVDMAKMKSEVLHQYQETHGYSFRSRIFGSLGSINRLGCFFAPVSNWIAQSSLGKKLNETLGIHSKRQLPPFASPRFSTWLRRNYQPKETNPQVVLFNDTYVEFNYPQIGRSALQILEEMGFHVIVPQWSCCGRPLFSKGLLKQAKKKAQKLVNNLYPYAVQGIPILVLEPSCASMLMEDLLSLVQGKEVETVMEQTQTFDEFLYECIRMGRWDDLNFVERQLPVKVHGHCHQKSLIGLHPTLQVLKHLPGLQVEAIQSGCCGMAGSFGYEKEHYDFSLAVGETQLFPAIRDSEESTIFVANGLSCRHQIHDGTGKQAIHSAELVAHCLCH